MKKISVIIPVYNVEAELSKCLDSVLLNTYTNLEIICICDGSTDRSLEILKEYEKRDLRIIVINQENKGVSQARNAGLDACTGEFIAFIDSDDWIHPQYFEIMLHAMDDFDGEIVACQYEKKFNNEFDFTDTQRYPVKIGSAGDSEDIQNHIQENKIQSTGFCGSYGISVQILRMNDIMQNHDAKSYIWGKLYKRKVIEKIRYAYCPVSQDKLFNLQLLLTYPNVKMKVLDCRLYYYYQREGSSVHRMSSERYIFFLRECAKLAEKDEINELCKGYAILEALKAGFFVRYSAKFDTDNLKISQEAKEIIARMIWELKKNNTISKKKKIQYYVMAKCSFVYRWYRILDDRTMLDWERKQKLKRKLHAAS